MAKFLAIVVLIASVVASTLAVVGQVPAPQKPAVQPAVPPRPGSYSGAAGGSSLSRSASTGSTSSSSSAVSNADPATLDNAVNVYNALVAVIRDVVLKAKLTPIGGTEGINYVESCSEHKAKTTKGAETKSGVYTIWPTGKVLDGPKQVWCDMETDGGGWTVISRRGYGNVARDQAENFNKNWREYKTGFGMALKDYWLGLESMNVMGRRCTNELLVVLTYFDDTQKVARYSNFTIGPETDNYRLHVTGFVTGTAGDVLEKKHDGLVFATSDKDTEDKCAVENKSGWWFHSKKSKGWCDYTNLNGELKATANDAGGMTWRYSSLLKGWTAPALKKSEMKIRPKCPPS